MTVDDVLLYEGLPYATNPEEASGPDAYNCWGLVAHLQEKYFGKTIPFAPIGNYAECLSLYRERTERGNWVQVPTPSHGDAALLRGGTMPHVGIYLDLQGGGILHALEGFCVMFTPVSKLKFHGFARTKYYRIQNEG